MLLRAQGNLAGAQTLFERSVSIYEQVLGSDHPATAISLQNLGMVLRNQGDLEAARPLYERALAIREQVLGPEHPETAASLNNLGRLLHDLGDHEAARPLLERALTISEKLMGNDHPDTISLRTLLRNNTEPQSIRRSIPSDNTPLVFISYAQFDDYHEVGALRRFRDEFSRTLQFVSGDEMGIFQGGTDVEIGQQVQERISQSLNDAIVLVPVLTPSFFTDPTCRDILTRFLERERQLGRNDLMLPVYYQRVPKLEQARESTDPLLQAVAQRQMLNWQPLRGKKFNDSQVKQELERLAKRITAILDELKEAQQAGSTTPSQVLQSANTEHQQPAAELQLSSELVDLLRAFVQAARSIPRDQRQPFTFASMSGNDKVVSSFVEHPGLSPERFPVYRGDIEELLAAGFLRQNSLQEGRDSTVLKFDITNRGYNYYDQQEAAKPLTQSPPSSLTVGQRRRLQQKLDGLQQEWSLRGEKLQQLRRDLVIETNPGTRLKLEIQVTEEEAAQEKLTVEIEEIERYLHDRITMLEQRLEEERQEPNDDITSLHRQLAEAEKGLRLVQERKTEYALEKDIPRQLIKSERDLHERIIMLEQRITELSSDEVIQSEQDLIDDDTNYNYDVFISYATSDREWVSRELLGPLEGAGLRVCIDYRDFTPGAAILDEIERAMHNSRKTIFVFSPAYLEGVWTRLEQWVLQTVDPANRERHFLVLLRETCDIPQWLQPFSYVDFRDPAQRGPAWERLSQFLGVEVSSGELDHPEQLTIRF
jgi:tetratricopeptide (TPR) repeat protein